MEVRVLQELLRALVRMLLMEADGVAAAVAELWNLHPFLRYLLAISGVAVMAEMEFL
jgi:hypothetical protein